MSPVPPGGAPLETLHALLQKSQPGLLGRSNVFALGLQPGLLSHPSIIAGLVADGPKAVTRAKRAQKRNGPGCGSGPISVRESRLRPRLNPDLASLGRLCEP